MNGILIIEQSAATTRDLMTACAAAGLPVIGVASDGLEGVALARTLQPSHVTVDLVLPRLGGLQVMQALARHGLTPIVIVVSAVTAREAVVAARAAGARAYLLKPMATAKLAEILVAARDVAQPYAAAT